MAEVFAGLYKDPLEQFLLANIFPGCPVNNGDSSILVIALASAVLGYLFFTNILYNVGFYRYLSKISTILVYSTKKNNIFLCYLLSKCFEYVNEVSKKKFNTTVCVLTKYVHLTFTRVSTKDFIEIFVSNVIKFIYSIIKENLFVKKYPFFTVYYFSFLIILFFNVLGLLPNSYQFFCFNIKLFFFYSCRIKFFRSVYPFIQIL